MKQCNNMRTCNYIVRFAWVAISLSAVVSSFPSSKEYFLSPVREQSSNKHENNHVSPITSKRKERKAAVGHSHSHRHYFDPSVTQRKETGAEKDFLKLDKFHGHFGQKLAGSHSGYDPPFYHETETTFNNENQEDRSKLPTPEHDVSSLTSIFPSVSIYVPEHLKLNNLEPPKVNFSTFLKQLYSSVTIAKSPSDYSELSVSKPNKIPSYVRPSLPKDYGNSVTSRPNESFDQYEQSSTQGENLNHLSAVVLIVPNIFKQAASGEDSIHWSKSSALEKDLDNVNVLLQRLLDLSRNDSVSKKVILFGDKSISSGFNHQDGYHVSNMSPKELLIFKRNIQSRFPQKFHETYLEEGSKDQGKTDSKHKERFHESTLNKSIQLPSSENMGTEENKSEANITPQAIHAMTKKNHSNIVQLSDVISQVSDDEIHISNATIPKRNNFGGREAVQPANKTGRSSSPSITQSIWGCTVVALVGEFLVEEHNCTDEIRDQLDVALADGNLKVTSSDSDPNVLQVTGGYAQVVIEQASRNNQPLKSRLSPEDHFKNLNDTDRFERNPSNTQTFNTLQSRASTQEHISHQHLRRNIANSSFGDKSKVEPIFTEPSRKLEDSILTNHFEESRQNQYHSLPLEDLQLPSVIDLVPSIPISRQEPEYFSRSVVDKGLFSNISAATHKTTKNEQKRSLSSSAEFGKENESILIIEESGLSRSKQFSSSPEEFDSSSVISEKNRVPKIIAAKYSNNLAKRQPEKHLTHGEDKFKNPHKWNWKKSPAESTANTHHLFKNKLNSKMNVPFSRHLTARYSKEEDSNKNKVRNTSSYNWIWPH